MVKGRSTLRVAVAMQICYLRKDRQESHPRDVL
jgi:hypothetical protein